MCDCKRYRHCIHHRGCASGCAEVIGWFVIVLIAIAVLSGCSFMAKSMCEDSYKPIECACMVEGKTLAECYAER